MPDSPRLAELRRQRALVQEHLAWLDREIAAAGGTGASTTAQPAADNRPPVAPSTTGLTGAAPAAVAAVDTAADAILEDYRTPASKLQQDVRLGCFMYFAAALVAVGAGVVVLYFLLRHR
jgi:hypothetical protein